ncbi:MAG TPA: substrate-binding domain-containing protein [Stellaceae bacterium]|nr:substrate-binding domain-containing protein [Stellaceae bacterium]
MAAIAAGALIAPAFAAEIKVLSTMNIRPALEDVRGQFERTNGARVILDYKGAAATRKRVEDGEPGDVVINSRPTLEALLRLGKIRPGSIVDVAHASIGVVVRAGAPKPDIATDEALVRALLGARSIAYPDPAQGSLGGNYFAGLIDRLGIAAQLKSKTRLVGGGAPAGQVVAAGDADLGINQIAELMSVPGIAFVSPLPPSLTDKVVMAAAILTAAKEPDTAAQWIRFLSSPAAIAALKAHGMGP